MLPPSSWKAATAASATSAAATAYSESSRPDSSLQNFLITFVLLYALQRSYLMVFASELILVPMLPPSSWKAATAASATSAAATAYSDNSRPVSSRKNLLIIFVCSFRLWLVVVEGQARTRLARLPRAEREGRNSVAEVNHGSLTRASDRA